MRLRTFLILLVAAVAASAAAVASANQRAPLVEYRFPVTAEDAVVAHASSQVQTDTLFANERVVVWPGTDGLERRYTYYEEKWTDGKLEWRKAVHPKGKPRATTITTGTPAIILVGTRRGAAFGVSAASESGQRIGSVGASGTIRVEAHGTITFSGVGTEAGPGGNTTHRYYSRPIRPDVPPGALLFRVGSGPWRALKQLTAEKGTYVITGQPGQPVVGIVNDANDQFGDNRGSFQVIVWPEGVTP